MPSNPEIARLSVLGEGGEGQKGTAYVAHVVASDWGPYEGWRKPLGVYSTEDKALAAIGRATVGSKWFADKLRVITLEVDAPLLDDKPGEDA